MAASKIAAPTVRWPHGGPLTLSDPQTRLGRAPGGDRGDVVGHEVGWPAKTRKEGEQRASASNAALAVSMPAIAASSAAELIRNPRAHAGDAKLWFEMDLLDHNVRSMYLLMGNGHARPKMSGRERSTTEAPFRRL